MVVPFGMRNFFKAVRASLKYQPPMLIALAPEFRNSIASSNGGSEWVSTSLMTTFGMGR